MLIELWLCVSEVSQLLLALTNSAKIKSSIKRVGLVLLSLLSVFSDSEGTDFTGLTPGLALTEPSPPTLHFKHTGDPLHVQQSASAQIKS